MIEQLEGLYEYRSGEDPVGEEEWEMHAEEFSERQENNQSGV